MRRREFLKALGFGAAALGVARWGRAAESATAAAPGAKPNIILMVADDLGYNDLSCYGATKITTPRIDALAGQGVRLTDAHSTCAICIPSRYSILSGTYYFHAKFKGRYPLMFHEGQVTLPSLLKSAGYRTAALGKWHNGFGREPEPDYNKELKPGPLEIGFDSFFGTPRTHSEPPLVFVQDHWVVGLDPADPISVDHSKQFGAHGKQIGGAKAAAARPDDQIDFILADKAARYFAEQKPGRPFFLYLAFAAVHNPIDPAPEFRQKSKAGLYGDYAEQLDHCTGLVLDALEKNGLAQDTLVIFTSDNGGRYENTAMKAGHRTNGELLGQKTDAWEGGHRVPCIARWPNHIPAGTVRKEFFVQVDFMATLAEAAGIPLPKGASPDGSSELTAFLQPTVAPAKRTEALLQGTKGIVLRQGDWIYFPKQGSLGYTAPEPERPFGLPYAKMGFTNSDIDEHGQIKPGAPREQLYNLAADLRQRKNLALEDTDRVRAMRARFLELAGPVANKTPGATE
jgi:arylsulfatase A